MKKRIITSIFIMGVSGIIAQILLLRELLIVFQGNELSIGIILANWLLLEAAGSFFLGKAVEKRKRKIEWLVFLQIAFSVFLPVAIVGARELKLLMGLGLGQGLNIFSIFYGSALILALPSIVHGSLFTTSCRVYSACTDEKAEGISKVYILETFGTIVGGIVFTYLLIPRFHSLHIAFFVSLLNILCCVWLIADFWKKDVTRLKRVLGVTSTIFLLGFLTFIFSPLGDRLHWHLIHRQWKGQQVAAYKNSHYGNIVVIRQDAQFTFFSDGIPLMTTPTPDIVFVEEFVHLPLLSHPDPKDILVISAGAGGVIHEILKHPSVERVDYAEMDPAVLEMVKKFPTALSEFELNDPKVAIRYADGRFFLKKTNIFYDAIFIGVSSPSDLQVNRLFTKEFFALSKKRLSSSGALIISLPGDSSYLGYELANLNVCILNTLNDIFSYVRVIPGEGTNLYIASDNALFTSAGALELSERIQERGLSLSLINEGYIAYKLHPRWTEWFFDAIKGATTEINRDLRPIGMFFSLSYWNAIFSPSTSFLFRKVEKVSLAPIVAGIFLITFVFFILRFRFPRLRSLSIPVSVFTTGFFGMISDLVLIFAFQAFYGYVFHWVGLLVTACMVGVGLGSILMMKKLEQIKKDRVVFLQLEGMIILFSLILPVLLMVMIRRPFEFGMQGIFLLLALASGFFVGAQFPLASKMHLAQRQNHQNSITQTAGLLYALDLAGGWLGGMVGAVVLVAVLGVWGTCMVMAALKIASATLLFFSK